MIRSLLFSDYLSNLLLLISLELRMQLRNIGQILLTIFAICAMAFIFSYSSSDFLFFDSLLVDVNGATVSSMPVATDKLGVVISIASCISFISILIYGQNLLYEDINSGRFSFIFSKENMRQFFLAKIISYSLVLSIINIFSLPFCALFLNIGLESFLRLLLVLISSFPFIASIMLFSQIITIGMGGGNANSGNNANAYLVMFSFLLCMPLLISPLLLCVGFVMNPSFSIIIGLLGLGIIMIALVFIAVEFISKK